MTFLRPLLAATALVLLSGCAGPTVHYDYDVPTNAPFTAGSATNLVGRIVDAYVKSGSTYIAANAYSYDPVGRQQTIAGCTIEDCLSPW